MSDTKTNEQQLFEFWLNVSAFYRQNISDQVLKMYVYDTKDFTIDEMRKAFEIYRNSSESNFFPLPGSLKRMIRPEPNEEDESLELASIIFEAVKKFGYINPTKAREFIGELGWSVLEGFGSWAHFCQLLSVENQGIIRAQIRDSAKAKLRRAKAGRTELPPGYGMEGYLECTAHSNRTSERIVPNNPALGLYTPKSLSAEISDSGNSD